jgi:hypothetical protein
MNPDMLKLVVAGVAGAHGIGHVLGWMPAWRITTFEGLSSRSWLLSDLLGDGLTRAIGGALWLAPTIGFVAAAGGFFADQSWWRPLATASAVASLVAIVLFWEALPLGSRVGAVVVNLAVIAAVATNWQPA